MSGFLELELLRGPSSSKGRGWWESDERRRNIELYQLVELLIVRCNGIHRQPIIEPNSLCDFELVVRGAKGGRSDRKPLPLQRGLIEFELVVTKDGAILKPTVEKFQILLNLHASLLDDLLSPILLVDAQTALYLLEPQRNHILSHFFLQFSQTPFES